MFLVVLTTSLGAPLTLLPERARHGSLARSFEPENIQPWKRYWLTVPLDWERPFGKHFDIRYCVDDRHFDASNDSAPIFVGMGGEGGGCGGCISYRSTALEDFKALCVGVEHRFYGQSIPQEGGVSTSNYQQGLSVEANLRDTAAVIKAVRSAHKTRRGQARNVMNFGGSYSGGTCAWMRQRYPDSTAGCVSASGVVNAIVDFTRFDSHVAQAIGAPCATALRAAQASIDAAFDAGGGDRLKRLFNASNLIGTPMGDSDFMYAVADGPAMLDQYGHKRALCEGLATLPVQPTSEQRILNLAEIIKEHYGPSFVGGCFYDSECVRATASLIGSASLVANTSLVANGGKLASSQLAPATMAKTDARSWRWQKCSELAYLQSAPSAGALRSPRLTFEALKAQCDRIFGDGTSASLLVSNRKFNQEYGGADPTRATLPVAAASNIMYITSSATSSPLVLFASSSPPHPLS